jgi:hypothetical protein
LLVVTNEKI